MGKLLLSPFHNSIGATFSEVNGCEVVSRYGAVEAEYNYLRAGAGLLDLSFRSRICVTGPDRVRFLHGQVTNDIRALKQGQGCYAALITAKGKMESDLIVYALEEELLLDFEPGLTAKVSERLEKYIIADDVQLIDVAPHYGLLSVQGPMSDAALAKAGFVVPMDTSRFSFSHSGEMYVCRNPRIGSEGFDLFIPNTMLEQAAQSLLSCVRGAGGDAVGWEALEMARIEAGIPRFNHDMDETNIPLEAGLEANAVSFNKGCYIGQEVISRIRTYGQVAKALKRLQLVPGGTPPKEKQPLYKDGKAVGYVTSFTRLPSGGKAVGLGYVRKEANQPGTELVLDPEGAASKVEIVESA